MRTILTLFFTLIGALTILLGNGLFHYCVSSGFSWTFAALSTWITLLVCLIFILWISFRAKEKKVLQIIIGCSLSIALLVGNFIVRPIYQGDFNKEGKPLNISKNSLLDLILNQNSDYDGLICIASPTCPHCKKAAKERLKVMKERNASLQIGIALYTKDTMRMNNFKKETETQTLPYYLIQDAKGAMELCHGAFPTFIYIKDKKVVHVWQNNEFGFPALDWIENKLN